MTGKPFRIVEVLPTLLGTYGDRGNGLVLRHRAQSRGYDVTVVTVSPGDGIPRDGDLYLVGGGEDDAQMRALELMRADGGIQAAVDADKPILAICAGLQLLGTSFTARGGASAPGLGIVDIATAPANPRSVGEVVAIPDPALGLPVLLGFENHQGHTTRGPGVKPLAQVVMGNGNGDGTEGFISGRIIGTYLHGPALARNPGLADLLLTWATGDEQQPLDDSEVDALRAERMKFVGYSRP
jgi:lipid II isoglutaminyl synthase (glutamine-hydrolysing)